MPAPRLPTPLKLGLIGFPLEHSLSPAIHQAALAVLGIPGDYQLYPIPPTPDSDTALVEIFEQLRRGELHGLNVTIPHKQAAFARVDDLTRAARQIGSVNTLYARSSRITGHNTDAQGFRRDLHHLLGGRAITGDALVLGAGGSARAVVYALLSDGWSVTLAARRLEQALHMAARFHGTPYSRKRRIETGSVSAIELQPAPIRKFLSRRGAPLLVVNTTPAGMAPHTDASPWPEQIPLPEEAYIYDLVYNPAETNLVRSARLAGLTCSNGLGMLVHQAALAFERWTGQSAPLQVMAAAAAAALENKTA
jgi:shikimate dehydrogenase